MNSDDIRDEWQEILDAVFKLVELFKIPGRKAKGKLKLLKTNPGIFYSVWAACFEDYDLQKTRNKRDNDRDWRHQVSSE